MSTGTAIVPAPFDLPRTRAISSLRAHLRRYKGELLKARRLEATLVSVEQAEAAVKTLIDTLALLGAPVSETPVRARAVSNRKLSLSQGEAVRAILRILKGAREPLDTAILAQEVRLFRTPELDESWDAQMQRLILAACKSLERSGAITRTVSAAGPEEAWVLGPVS